MGACIGGTVSFRRISGAGVETGAGTGTGPCGFVVEGNGARSATDEDVLSWSAVVRLTTDSEGRVSCRFTSFWVGGTRRF